MPLNEKKTVEPEFALTIDPAPGTPESTSPSFALRRLGAYALTLSYNFQSGQGSTNINLYVVDRMGQGNALVDRGGLPTNAVTALIKQNGGMELKVADLRVKKSLGRASGKGGSIRLIHLGTEQAFDRQNIENHLKTVKYNASSSGTNKFDHLRCAIGNPENGEHWMNEFEVQEIVTPGSKPTIAADSLHFKITPIGGVSWVEFVCTGLLGMMENEGQRKLEVNCGGCKFELSENTAWGMSVISGTKELVAALRLAEVSAEGPILANPELDREHVRKMCSTESSPWDVVEEVWVALKTDKPAALAFAGWA